MRRPSGLVLILAATVIASAASYLVVWLVPLRLGGFAEYKTFGLFWSAMYFTVGALAGIQQEVTRATTPRDPSPTAGASPARGFGLVVGVVVFAVLALTAPLWADAVFDGSGSLALPLAFAAATYVMVATLAGTLYGISGFVALALMISVDALLRLALLLVLAGVTSDPLVLAWASAVPFPLTIAVLWPFFRHRVAGRTRLDVGYRRLSWNVARTLVASASAGIIVSGLPIVIGVAGEGEPAAFVAALFTVVTLARAPVIVAVTSLQSYLVVRFRDAGADLGRRLVRLQLLVLAGSVALALIAWPVGPPVIALLYGERVELDGWVYAVLVLSSGLIGSLVVSATAVLARAGHVVYSLGWLVAALTSFACFALPLDLLAKTVVAVLVGPVGGLAVHLVALAARRPVSRPVE